MAKTFPARELRKYPLTEMLERVGMNCKEASEKYAVSERTIYRWMKEEEVTSPAYHLILKDLKRMDRQANNISRINAKPFSYIDLFAGIGGFRKAFDAVGGNCVFTSEWDKSCRITYQANNICNHPVVGDIREYTQDNESLCKIPEHQLLVGGFPCQPFSIAGVSKKNSLGRAHGFKCDTQGTLFFDVAQIIEHHRPPAFLLENVKNLISHDGGNTFRVILRTLKEELGYHVSYRIIDGKGWVPQHRERIFIVGFKYDVGFSFDDFKLPEAEDRPVLENILHGINANEEDDPPFFEYGKVADKYTLSDKLWNYLKDYKEKHAAKGNGFGYSLNTKNDVARTLSARYYKDGSEILIHQEGNRPRRLTPRECSRLMGFDSFTGSEFRIPVSDTQAYRQFGNSVVVPLAKEVAEFMKPYMLKSIQKESMNKKLSATG